MSDHPHRVPAPSNLLPQFALDCDEADDITLAIARLREEQGKINESIRIHVFEQAIRTHPLPVKCLDVLVDMGFVPMGWIHQMCGNDTLDWPAALNWWAKGGEPKRIDDIAEAADYALWKTQEFGIGIDHPQSPARQAHAILETLALYSYSEHDFRRRCGCASEGGGAMLMAMAALYPNNNWMAKAGLDPVHLLWDGLAHSLIAYDLLIPKTGGSLLDRWRATHPLHEQAWQTVWNNRIREVQDMGQWIDEWMPGSKWNGSALEQWCQSPSAKGQGRHPLDGWVSGTLDTHPNAVASMLERKLGVVGHTTEHARRAQLRAAIVELCGKVVRHTPDYLPTPVGLALCPTRDDERMVKWLDTHATTEVGRREILAVLGGRDAGRILERTPMERIVKWMDSGTQEWADWKNPQGQSLFLFWLASRQPHERHIKPSVLRDIAKKSPQWFTEHTEEGKTVIDTLTLPDTLEADIKRTLLDLERTDHSDRPQPKRRF